MTPHSLLSLRMSGSGYAKCGIRVDVLSTIKCEEYKATAAISVYGVRLFQSLHSQKRGAPNDGGDCHAPKCGELAMTR